MNTESILSAVALLALMLAGCNREASESGDMTALSEPDKGYVVLDATLAQLKQDFNANRDKVRLLFIVGDTCGICLRGMADLNDAFLARAQADDRLLTLVVHVPTLGAQERHVPEAMQLMQGPRIIHYWDGSGISGLHLVRTLETDGVYAWDVWLVYGPEAEWAGEIPPPPEFWMHQLGSLDRELRLDAERFGEMTLSLMQQVSASDLVERQASEAELLADGTVISSVAQPRGTAISTHIRGAGGYQRLKAVQTIHRQGTFTSGSISADLVVTENRESGLQREYVDSSVSLPAMVEVAIAESWEMDGPLVDWKDKGHQARMSGMRKIGASLAWKLYLRQSNGMRWALYVDSHTGDLILQERLDESGQVVFSITASDFEVFDGLRLPDTIEYRDSTGELIAAEEFTQTRIES